MARKRRIVGIVVAAIVFFAFMAILYPLIRGQPVLDVPWLVISAITAVIFAPLGDFLSRRRRQKRSSQEDKASGDAE
ncbi:hypothetical protein JW848_08025 [Candidatus Bipolaricaulota bacterium]|nr:hypothetical protein [Candidatus Bipolaricaulota bacterium]